MMGETLDEAVYRSWNNQKKEYQDEIRKLTNEMSKYCEKLARIQSKLLSGDVNARGHNSVNKQEYDKYDHCNADIVSGFCKSIMFPQYKFLEPSYMIFSLEYQRSLCYKINGMIEKPLAITSDLDHKYYWDNYTVLMINKEYCEMRSNFNTDLKKKYIGE
jgi:hypothetical protein